MQGWDSNPQLAGDIANFLVLRSLLLFFLSIHASQWRVRWDAPIILSESSLRACEKAGQVKEKNFSIPDREIFSSRRAPAVFVGNSD